MTTIPRTLALLSALTISIGATAAAQEGSAADLLTSIEVRQLIASPEPADHARLRDHFLALSARYEADAERHEAMALALTGNPNRGVGSARNLHCARLAELAKASAAATRDLAAHHDRLAMGVASSAPEEGAAFEEGAGAPEPTDRHILELAAGARTSADHRLLEDHFVELAARYEAERKQHTEMAAVYRVNPRSSLAAAAEHCDRLARSARAAAAEAAAQAAEHRKLAAASNR